MCPREESNLYLELRRFLFYPLNYKGFNGTATNSLLQSLNLFRHINLSRLKQKYHQSRHYFILQHLFFFDKLSAVA